MIFRTVKIYMTVFCVMILQSLVGGMNVLEEHAASIMLVDLPTYQTAPHHSAIGNNFKHLLNHLHDIGGKIFIITGFLDFVHLPEF
jgi:hypothetical protein